MLKSGKTMTLEHDSFLRPSLFILCLTALAVLAFSFVSAPAQVYYEYPGAPVVQENQPAAGPYIAVGDNLFRTGGFARFNIVRDMDLGLEVVFDRIHSDWFAGAAGDVKYAIIPANVKLPFDWSLNAGLGFTTGSSITTITIPLGTLVSRPLQLSGGSVLTPYGGLYVLIINTSIDVAGRNVSDTSTDVELRGGIKLDIRERVGAFTALHLGSGNKFYIGFNFKM
jgi:hypothetical protein